MKVRTIFQLGRWIMLIVPYCISMAQLVESSSTLEPLDYREAYFNGSAYIRLHSPITLQRQTGFSFRTCTGGELFSQLHNNNTIQLSVNRENLIFTATTSNGKYYETKINVPLLDNKWHTVSLRYVLGNYTLSVDKHSEVIANSHKLYHSELLTNSVLHNEGAILIVGKQYNGCLLEGPAITFNITVQRPLNIQFGPCPLPLNSCVVMQEMAMPRTEDHCFHEPCMRHGICISRPDKYECHCTARYQGNNCQVDRGPPCARTPSFCKNDANCTEDARGDYTCVCRPGFTGKHCEQPISSLSICDTNPCMNNGTCRMLPNRKKECNCPPGFTGSKCETNVDECSSNPCLNDGTCIDGINGFQCLCDSTGYRGTYCEDNINECLSNPCTNDGVCYDTYGSYTCQCPHGFDGQNCEVNLNECLTQPCSNRGTCVDKEGGYECNCVAGYTGKHCETKLSSCDSSSCPPYADCVEHGFGSRCVCKPGIAGLYPNCTSGDSICYPNPCQNGGSCSSHLGTFNCTCQPGFTGPNCEQAQLCLMQPCRNGATCINEPFTYRCVCAESFTGSLCEQHIKCSDNPCMHSTGCQDYGRGYYCTCEPGWTGMNCNIDIDECQTEPCQNGATCINTRNDYICQCEPGYAGKYCQINVDECASAPCTNGGTCIDKINGYFCNCTEEFMGMVCEKPYNVCELQPCQNGGTCLVAPNKHNFTCDCVRGYEGQKCETNTDDCLNVKCSDGKQCVDGIADYSCQCPYGFTGDNCSIETDPCEKDPCKNGATCTVNPATYEFTCKCTSQWQGQYCESDVDECRPAGNSICGTGICVNKEGGYQCYCQPGYTGEQCNLDFDECLSMPCKHNATCLNKVNNYECVCTPGYTGKDCNININECNSNPCMEGSTCIDGIANFTCICQPGLTGQLCEINIDDCEHMPCQNNGACIDGLNSYKCNCADTGYSGVHCEFNIDDCISNPCQNGAECVDGVKDYICKCYDGYIGKNCEEDVDECENVPCKHSGTCLQNSNKTLYYSMHSDNPEYNNLPASFHKQFDYNTAAGYKCICVPGTNGSNCEININECEPSPCGSYGTCIDKINGYTCECEDGFEGVHCEIDIDECEKLQPCEHGICKDGRATYFCDCYQNYGGKNCTVELTGCNDDPCLNNGSCKPYLENETIHKFNCTCPNGFHGHSCERVTTMSMSGKSYVAVNTSREEGYDISFRFKTTLGDGLLAMGKGSTFYILELTLGRLNLRSSLLNKWEGVFIGSNLNDSNWQKVFVAINSTHLVLSANEEQTIYPININEGTTNTSFPITYLGGTINTLKRLAHGPHFIGCTEDVVINGEWVLPQNSSWINLVDIEVGCSREPQCSPNPCHSGGRCTDKWRDFSCTCERPYLGHTCQYNYTAATFGYENITNSLVTVTVTDVAKRAVRNIVDISMFIRTRQIYGQIFYLGSSFSFNPDETYIAAQLEKGELLVRIQFNGTPEAYTVGGVALNNGCNHLIQVIRNITLVQVKINGTEYFRKTISSTGQLDAQVLLLGGQTQVRATRQATSDNMVTAPRIDTTPATGPIAATTSLSPIHFKGIIQDVQISNGSRIMVVEFFPLKVHELKIPTSFGSVTFDQETVREGVLSDDSCRINPCQNNGVCVNTWNDYRCECPRGFKGKDCGELEFCQVEDCPSGSTCRNLDDGYECVANATLNGEMPPAIYNVAPSMSKDTVLFDTLEVSYRTKFGGTVLFAKSSSNYFIIFVINDQIIFEWKIDGYKDRKFVKKENSYGEWVTLYLKIKDSTIEGGSKESVTDGNPNFSSEMNALNFTNLFTKGNIFVGGSDNKTFDVTSAIDNYAMTSYNASSVVHLMDDANGMGNTVELPNHAFTTDQPIRRIDFFETDKRKITDRFKGCIGEVRIGSYLLPFFETNDIYNNTQNLPPKHFDLKGKTNFVIGCILCYQHDCLHGGICENPASTYKCKCPAGYTAEDCSVDIDECVDNNCANNATCIDSIANYSCNCVPGYEGWLCDKEIDECQSSPCRNGGSCVDELNNYNCECPEEYVGKQCEAKRQITCESQPCYNGSTCIDGFNKDTGNNFTCTCTNGMSGPLCDTAFCVLRQCEYGRCLTNVSEPYCLCQSGFDGKFCDNNIDDCKGEPCLHGGNCTDGIAQYTCDCSETGFSGDSCEIDIDECRVESRCGRGKCENKPGTFRCICEDGMCGHGCLVADPCYNVNRCGEHGTCESLCTTEPDFKCVCRDNFIGSYCNETEVSASQHSNSINAIIIIAPIVLLILIGGGIGLAVFIAMARSKRATRGTYSPSAQEFCNPRVELDHVLKPPPEERLI